MMQLLDVRSIRVHTTLLKHFRLSTLKLSKKIKLHVVKQVKISKLFVYYKHTRL